MQSCNRSHFRLPTCPLWPRSRRKSSIHRSAALLSLALFSQASGRALVSPHSVRTALECPEFRNFTRTAVSSRERSNQLGCATRIGPPALVRLPGAGPSPAGADHSHNLKFGSQRRDAWPTRTALGSRVKTHCVTRMASWLRFGPAVPGRG